MNHALYAKKAMRRAARVLCAGLLISALAGCAGMSEQAVNSAFVAPGKYDVYDCRSLARTIATTQERELELRQLMERSAQSPGGELVNAIAYRSDYMRARAELNLLNETAANKNCQSSSKWSSERSVF
jgi:hypothetical protein